MLVGALVAAAGVAPARQANVELMFQATLRANPVTVGDEIVLEISFVSGGETPTRGPTAPDIGGLSLITAPSLIDQSSMINSVFVRTVKRTYRLAAPGEGTYRIGPSEVDVGGRTMKTQALTVIVEPENLSALPESLRGEPIVNPKTPRDAELQEQLRGRIFVRPYVSNARPWVSESVVIGYDLYYDPLVNIPQVRIGKPTLDDAQVYLDKEWQATSLRPVTVTLDDRQYYRTTLYEAAVTPTRSGDISIGGFESYFELPGIARNRGRDPFENRSPFRSLFQESAPSVRAPGGALRLEVRPLPAEGMPPGFPGTVGAFTIASRVDQEEATEDDLIVLTVTIEGRGNVALAPEPEFDGGEDFTLREKKSENEWPLEGAAGGRELRGRKTIEYYLAPSRSGYLTIPAIEYPVFDLDEEVYRTLRTDPVRIKIDGETRAEDLLPGEIGESVPTRDDELRLIKPLGEMTGAAPRPLAENPLFWMAQAAALALAALVFLAARRAARADPAQVRRGRAWKTLDRKLGRAPGGGGDEAAALALERALREFVADWYDLAPDGLTHDEIAARLDEAGVAAGPAARLKEIMTACANIRYAPAAADGTQFEAWSREAREILAGGLK